METKIELTDEQVKDIKSKLALLKSIAQLYGTPMFASVVVSNSNDHTRYLRVYGAQTNKSITLTETQINEIDTRQAALKEAVQMCGVPMFATVCVLNSECTSKFLRVVHAAQSHAISLYDDEIRKHMLIANGFEAVPKKELSEDAINQILHKAQPYGSDLTINEIKRHVLVSLGFDVDLKRNNMKFDDVSEILKINGE